jgi:hypothetical protein
MKRRKEDTWRTADAERRARIWLQTSEAQNL